MGITDGELVERLAREAERLKILEILRKCESIAEAVERIEALNKK
ncbi:MAG: protein phosphatase [Oscillospiraceae bacterium]|jgi:hypothetical protein|nr:protein phosphatase [Oscillospiraceae bacterium]